jgi:NAD(P) transhydrogenase
VNDQYVFVVIGAGPAGQKAAQTAAEAGRRVLLLERGEPGGECVHRGTIPSKTMRETALSLAGLRRSSAGDACANLGPSTMVESLMGRLDQVLSGYSETIRRQVEDSGVELQRGRASLVSAHEVEVLGLDGKVRRVKTEHIVLAVGSRPRTPPGVPVDHEHILDSDSLLDLIYLPESMTVLGAGVIACEFASVFQTLGVRVTMVDRYAEPLGFVDPDLSSRFRSAFEAAGGTFVGETTVEDVAWDGFGSVVTKLSNGETLSTQKMLVAQGRTASLRGLGVEQVGLELTSRGLIQADEHHRTNIENIYAIGDVIGPPALAASSMSQGRRAVRHALGLDPGATPEDIPAGIYTIPELAFVGLTEAAARERFGHDVLVGRAEFSDLARARINGAEAGMLKLITDATGERILGVHVVGEGAVELVHLGQLARVGGLAVDAFVDQIFNFPTFAEAYRVAALDVIAQRAAQLERKAG